MGNERLRGGVIGIGVMGWNHARTLAAMRDVELIGVVDAAPERRAEAERAFHTRSFHDAAELLALGPDVVVIATPNSLHYDIGLQALAAGAHVLMEKPIAATLEQAQALIAAAEAHGRVLMVGHIERFNPAVRVAQKAAEGEQIISINIARVGPFPPRMTDVGVVIDLGVHDIDLVRMIAGSDIIDVQAQLSSARALREDTALLQFRTANNVIAGIATNWTTPYKMRTLQIATTKKYISADLMTRQVAEYFDYKPDGSYSMRHLSVPIADALKDELEAFLHAVRTGASPPITGHDGLRNLEIAFECLRVGVRPA